MLVTSSFVNEAVGGTVIFGGFRGFSDLSESSHFHAQSERMLGGLRAFCVLQYSYWAKTRGIG